MKYSLQIMSDEDKLQVLRDADEAQRRRFERFRYFETHPDFKWVIREDKAAYMLRGPKGDIKSRQNTLFIKFDKILHEVEVFGFGAVLIKILNQDRVTDASAFSNELRTAFSVHGIYGGAFPEVPAEIKVQIEGGH